ncbi:MAG: hypothetical protein ACJAWL_001229 [Motiliproteus sp.]|jgi:hypothetical protein
MLSIVLSASNAMNKWLKLDLPRIPSPDGKRIGTQPLVTDTQQLSWQCHVVPNSYRSKERTVIVTEAYSRYTLLLPYRIAPTVEAFEKDFLERFEFEVQQLMLESGALELPQLARVKQQFDAQKKTLSWFRNTDMSVNGHVGDAEQWLRQMLADKGSSRLSEKDALGLGDHLNKLRKRAKQGQSSTQSFYPVARLLDDGLYRFASGLADGLYPETPLGDFPKPYPDREETRSARPSRDNVVYMADFRP